MTLEKQIKHINNSLFVAKMENIIQFMYEDELKTSVAEIFHSMRTEILANLEAYYGDVLFNAHMDLILAPIHEHHKQYYETIMKYKLKEHRKGRVQGKRLITRAKKYAKQYSKAYYGNSGAVKADTINIPMSSIIEKDNLFATSDYSAEQMRDKTFVASENTLARVDKDINGIITDGYRDGWGINDVANKIETRFNQLETWEARRIARTEIHGSHMQGVMNSYEDMGVEYLQWGAAHDNRTRDTHAALDGEIIPWNGVFSNGLRYPGDTNGPIQEWINCRCGVLPWFCPPGFMVPVGMTNFRESDLIPTHAFQTTEDRLKQYQTDNVDKVLNQINQRSDNWDIYRLTPGEREVYRKAKKNYIILDDAIKNKNYSRLDDLEDDPMMFIRDKKTFLTNTDNLTDFSLVKEEMEEYLDDIRDYEKIIKDTNITVDLTPRGIKWKNNELKDYYVLNDETGKYYPIDLNEKFVTYTFKKEGLVIRESVDMDASRVRYVYNEYKKLPKRLQNTNEIVLSNQKPVKISLIGKDGKLGGYVPEGKGTRIVNFKKSVNETVGTVVHEATHILEKDQLYYISNSREYVLAFKKDQKRLLDMGYELKDTYTTPYAHGFTEGALGNTGEKLAKKLYGHRAYSEDLAESMKEYLKNKTKFAEDYPEKTKVLEKILNGEFKPETTTPYKEWFKVESKRFRPTPGEMERAQKIKWKQTDLTIESKPLNKSEREFLEYIENKKTLDYLHNKNITGETLSSEEKKVYKELYRKFNKNPIMEETSSNLTETEIKQKLSKLSLEEKYELLDNVLDEGQLHNWIELTDKLDSLDYKLSQAIERNNQKAIEGFTKAKEKALNMMYEYERLIYTKPNKIPDIDFTKFIMDNQVGEVHTIKNTLLEKKQINIQNKIGLTSDESFALHTYGGKSHDIINGFFTKDEVWEEYLSKRVSEGWTEKEIIEDFENTFIKHIDSAMAKSPGLTQDTVIYSGAPFEGHLRVGDISSFDGYRSCSYQIDSAESFNYPERYMVKIYAPEGQKGIAMNGNGNHGERLGFYSHEHEFLLPKNQKFQVIEVDHEHQQATILLL